MELVDVKFVDCLLYNHVSMFWEHMGPIYLEARKRMGVEIYDSLENLYDMMKQRQQATVIT